MLGNAWLGITAAEAEQLVLDINNTFQQESWCLEFITPTQWVLESKREFELTTEPLTNVIGKSIGEASATGADARYWRAIVNEIQMYLHTHPVNLAREERGMPTINSVWLWGEGRLPIPPYGVVQDTEIWSDDPFARGLAVAHKLPVHSGIAGSLRDWLKNARGDVHHIVVVDVLTPVVGGREMDTWQRVLQQIEHEYIAPLLAALKQGELSQVTLMPCGGATYTLTRSRLRRWWKPAKSVFHYLPV
jgi:hypothetical protein